jgi:hypothetical protein
VRPHPLAAIGVAVVAFGMYLLFTSPDSTVDKDAMIGIWTDPAGPPGNLLRFYFVQRDIPGASYVVAFEGRLEMVDVQGRTDRAGTWGYGSFDPLVLNLTVNGRPWYVAIRSLDHDHLLMRCGTDAETIYAPGAVDHPEARVLTRVGAEPKP